MLDDALRCYKKILASPMQQERVCSLIEATIGKSNDIDFKIKNYAEFVGLVPSDFIFNYRLGYLYGKERNDLAKAVFYLQRAVEIRPNEIHALQALAHAYKLSKDYEKASFYSERAAAIGPE
jgi:tetratricopeptide (TPR) repeat protein